MRLIAIKKINRLTALKKKNTYIYIYMYTCVYIYNVNQSDVCDRQTIIHSPAMN